MELVEEALSKAIDIAVEKTLEGAAHLGHSLVGKLRRARGQVLKGYAVRLAAKHSKAKTFLVRQPTYLYDFYVPSSITYAGDNRLERVGVQGLAGLGGRVVIAGTGGSGKTMLMRHLLLDAFQAGSIPIFVELRNLNGRSEADLLGFLSESLEINGIDLPTADLRELILSGAFLLLLDGLDEVEFSRRSELMRQIEALVGQSRSQTIITSRLDSSLDGWSDFIPVRMANLSIEEACELVERVGFEHEISEKFVERLRGGLYEEHRYFLSNPLLLSMMLLTFGQNADIPKRRSSFYAQAFDVLFHQHDALKASYRRERKTSLDIYEFTKILSGFCMLSHLERKFRFDLESAIRFTRRSAQLTTVRDFEPAGFIDDCRQAVCLLVEDGLELSFAHRSFQEFFAARFISESSEEIKKQLIEKLTHDSGRIGIELDYVLPLVYELDPAAVEEYYLIPQLEDFLSPIRGRVITKAFVRRSLGSTFSALRTMGDDEKVWWQLESPPPSLRQLIEFLQMSFPERFDFSDWDRRWAEFSVAVRKALPPQKLIDGVSMSYAFRSKPVADALIDFHPVWSRRGFEIVRAILDEIKARRAERKLAIVGEFGVKQMSGEY